MTKRWLAPAMATVALALVAGCGGDDEDDDGGAAQTAPPAQTEATPTEEAGGGEEAGTATVNTKDIQFDPQDLTVSAGTTVTWTNEDEVPHTVTKSSGPGDEFDEELPPGGTVELTFEDAGTIEYVCEIHPGQDGTVTVE